MVCRPKFDRATVQAGQLYLTGTNGFPGGTGYLLASTDPQAPPASWTVVATNSFDLQGRFAVTNSINSKLSRRFFRLAQPLPPAAALLPLTIARFKTPTLRDLGHSDPYLHAGRKNTIEDVLHFYQAFSIKARLGNVRNPAPELNDINLDDNAVASLAAFLRSLNEDYTD